MARGPCVLELLGDVEVNGGRPGEGRLVVPAGRSVLVRLSEGARVGGTCVLESLPGEAYEAYLGAAERLLGLGGRILLVGPGDVGKSTLASFLVNRGGLGLLATDVGQNEVYAPGFESLLVRPGFYVPGAQAGEDEAVSCFVGAFSPGRAPLEYLGCAARLSRVLGGGLVVDTDGWVSRWEGLLSKAWLAHAVGADVVALVGLGEGEARVLGGLLPGVEIVVLPRLAGGAGKSREERRVHRERLIAKRLQGARSFSVDPGRVPVVGLPVFRGEPLGRGDLEGLGISGAVYGEVTGEGLVVVSRRPPPRGVRARWLRPGWERGLLAAAVCGGRERLALVEAVDYRGRRVRVRSHCMPEMLLAGRDRVDLEAYT